MSTYCCQGCKDSREAKTTAETLCQEVSKEAQDGFRSPFQKEGSTVLQFMFLVGVFLLQHWTTVLLTFGLNKVHFPHFHSRSAFQLPSARFWWDQTFPFPGSILRSLFLECNSAEPAWSSRSILLNYIAFEKPNRCALLCKRNVLYMKLARSVLPSQRDSGRLTRPSSSIFKLGDSKAAAAGSQQQGEKGGHWRTRWVASCATQVINWMNLSSPRRLFTPCHWASPRCPLPCHCMRSTDGNRRVKISIIILWRSLINMRAFEKIYCLPDSIRWGFGMTFSPCFFQL